jgi:hypothetical protein
MAWAIPHAMERLLATPIINALLPSRRPIIKLRNIFSDRVVSEQESIINYFIPASAKTENRILFKSARPPLPLVLNRGD